jgi:N12 class adenine-specific DNA methylase
MYLKTSQIMEKNGRDQGVVFLTGTPVSNSLAEMYHMMRYLMPSKMKEAGFTSFDAWANTFATIEDTLRSKTTGGYKSVKAFTKFANSHELLKMFDQVSDVLTKRT